MTIAKEGTPLLMPTPLDDIVSRLELSAAVGHDVAHVEVLRRISAAAPANGSGPDLEELGTWEFLLRSACRREKEFGLTLSRYGSNPAGYQVVLTGADGHLDPLAQDTLCLVLAWRSPGQQLSFVIQQELMTTFAAQGWVVSSGWATSELVLRACIFLTGSDRSLAEAGVDLTGHVIVGLTADPPFVQPPSGRSLRVRSLTVTAAPHLVTDPRLAWVREQEEAARAERALDEQRAEEAAKDAEQRALALVKEEAAAAHDALARAKAAAQADTEHVLLLAQQAELLKASKATAGLPGWSAPRSQGDGADPALPAHESSGWSAAELAGGFGPPPASNPNGDSEVVETTTPGDKDGVVVRWTKSDSTQAKTYELLRLGERWVLRGDDGDRNLAGKTILETLARCPEFSRIALGHSVVITAAASELTLADIVPLLRFHGRRVSQGEARVLPRDSEEWLEDDAVLDGLWPDVEFAHRWVSVNGTRLTGITTVTGADIVAVNIGGEELLPLKTIADGFWSSESGGAPISWEGSSQLVQLGAKSGAVVTRGDIDPEMTIFPWPLTAEELVSTVARWVCSQGYEAAAALALEPFDPEGTLSAAATARWKALFGALDMAVSFDLDPLLLINLRRELWPPGDTSPYSCVAAALLRPQGKLGKALEQTLEQVKEDRVIQSFREFLG